MANFQGMHCGKCVYLCDRYMLDTSRIPSIMCCAWCGNTDPNTVRHCETRFPKPKFDSQRPMKYCFQYYDFCVKKPHESDDSGAYPSCYRKYWEFESDLRWLKNGPSSTCIKYGFPYYMTGRKPSENALNCAELTCAACGTKSQSVIKNIYMPSGYRFDTFCKNDECIRQYLDYVSSLKKLPKVPYALAEELKKFHCCMPNTESRICKQCVNKSFLSSAFL
jgi:hypothetical protein